MMRTSTRPPTPGSSVAPAHRTRPPRRVPAGVLLVVTALCVAAGPAPAQEWKAHDVPLFVSASHPSGHEGFVRVVNRSDKAGEVVIDAVDDAGVPSVPVTLRIDAGETVHFNSGDLETGNTQKGLSAIGAGSGDWRLRLRSQLDLEVLAYNRTKDGLLASLHDLVPRTVLRRPGTGTETMGHRVAVFNPARNVNQVSRLRIINPGDDAAEVTVEGIDDDGESPGTAVNVSVPAGASRMIASRELESGEGEGLSGMLGDGTGKWQLVVTSDRPVEVMSLLSSPTGHLTNLSTAPEVDREGGATGQDVPLFAAAANRNGYKGFVRIINHSGEAGEVSVEAFDDDGAPRGPVTLKIGGSRTVHFNSADLEEGNAGKGLAEGIGEGIGNWRLRLSSDLDIEVLAYNRTGDGMLTTLHDVVPHTTVVRPGGEGAQGHDVAIFNPASNVNQVSRLRIINPGDEAAEVAIDGIDDEGASPGPGVKLTVPAGASRTLTARALESGEWDAGSGASGRLGDGKGKWRLVVTSQQAIEVMSLMTTPTGHLVNLSTAAPDGVPTPMPVVSASAAIEITGKSTASTGTPVALGVKSIRASEVAIERYEWVFSDGQRRSGEEVSVRFAESGVHEVTVSAMSGTDVVASAAAAVAVFDADAGANPGFDGIPALFGDVDRDGRFGRGDLALAEQAAAGLAELAIEAVEAGDLDLSGALDERDVALMRQALDDGAALPSAILDEFAYPGGVVAIVSPVLENPDADIEISVDGVQSPLVMRAILGYATFVVPESLTGRDAEVEVVVEAGGAVAERLRLLLKPRVTPAVSAKEDVLAFLGELAEVVAGRQRAGADFIAQNGGLSADETAIMLGAAKAAAEQIEDTAEALEALLDGEGGEELATLLQAALYAHGLAEFRERTRSASEYAMSAAGAASETRGSPADVCDIYVPAVCALKDTRGVLSQASKVANGLCEAAGLASVPALLVSLGSAAPILAFANTVCAPLTVAMSLADVLSGFVKPMTLGMRLSSDKAAIRNDASATITAEVTFVGLHRMCTDTTAHVSDKVDSKIVSEVTRLMLKKSTRLVVAHKVLKRLKASDSLLRAAVEKSVTFALTRTGLDRTFIKATDAFCEGVSFDAAGKERAAGLKADGRNFNLRASNGAPLRRNADGTYRLSCPANFTDTLTVSGSKELCDQPAKDSVDVKCEPAGLAPADQQEFDDRFVGKRINTSFGPYYYLGVTSPGRFWESVREEDDKPNNFYRGSYTYTNTGPNTGTIHMRYDDGDRCTFRMTFESLLSGSAFSNCHGSAVSVNWQAG